MTEAELWEMTFISTGNIASTFSVLLTVLFAFLATAYFVGRKLSTFQTAVVSVLFVWGALMLVLMVSGVMMQSLWFVQQLTQMHPEQTFVLSRTLVYSVITMMIIAILVSLYFMYQIRRGPELAAAAN